MSLRTFHILFVVIAEALLLGFGRWCFTRGAMPGLGTGSLLFAAAVLVYGILYFRKLTKLGATT